MLCGRWGNQVLWPGLFVDAAPGCGDIGPAGHFRSADPMAQNATGSFKGGCNDETWADGDGVLSRRGATGFTIDELVSRMNQMDWTDGILLTQSRVQRTTASACYTHAIGGECFPQMESPAAVEDQADFGYNWTHSNDSLALPFRWYSAETLGTNPVGEASAHMASLQSLPPGGYASAIIPFFSDSFLPDERGTSSQVTDFRLHRAIRHDGRETSRTPRFFCVRLSWDGQHLHQLCDPNDEYGRTTGVVRAAIEEFWNDLKRAHWIDRATRSVVLTTTISSNSLGARARYRMVFEFPSSGFVLASYDAMPMVTKSWMLDRAEMLLWIALVLTAFFCILELVEISGLQDGVFELSDIVDYVTNLWNMMDWLNYGLFFVTFFKFRDTIALEAAGAPCSVLCQGVGFQDDWELFVTMKAAKKYLSLCTCIQLLKIVKFATELIPKMGLAPSVLKRALPDICFHSLVFLISMVAFSSMFYVQLGPVMDEYYSPFASFVSLGRALFGDFDIKEIMDNSADYQNAMLFISYRFVACFILLSMFFAILGEAQANLRDDQRAQHQRDRGEFKEPEPEYGVLSKLYTISAGLLARAPVLGPLIRADREKAKRIALEETAPNSATAVDRIESRQLELQEKVELLLAAMNVGGAPASEPASVSAPPSIFVGHAQETTLLQVLELLKRTSSPKQKSRPGRLGGNSFPVVSSAHNSPDLVRGDARAGKRLAERQEMMEA